MKIFVFIKGELNMQKNYHCGDLLSPALQSMVEKKLSKLDKFDLENASVDVYMSKEGSEFAMKLQLVADGHDIIAKAKSNDMYKNIDDCLDRLTSQLKVQKER